jgi:hypothetical protein
MVSTYQINITHGIFGINRDRLIKTLPHGINQLKKEYDEEVIWKDMPSRSIDSTELKKMIEGYSEQLTPYAEEDMTEWFSYASGRMFDTDYPDLFYFADKQYEANKSSVAAIGEGIAGYVMTTVFDYDTLARPIGFCPDILMENKDGKIAFVEAKASISSKGMKGLGNIIKDTAIEVLGLIATAQYTSPKYVGFVIGTKISNRQFDVSVLELTYDLSHLSVVSHFKLKDKSPYKYKASKQFQRANKILVDKICERDKYLKEKEIKYDFINEILVEEIYKNKAMEYFMNDNPLENEHRLENPQYEISYNAGDIMHQIKNDIVESFGYSDYIRNNLDNQDAKIEKKIKRIIEIPKKG